MPYPIPSQKRGRLVVVCMGQSNLSGVTSLVASAPVDHNRNDARCFKRNAAKALVVASEPLHAGVDPNLAADGSDGLASTKIAVNDWLDANPGRSAIIIPRAIGSTSVLVEWAISPEAFYTKQCIDDALLGLRGNDRVVFLILRGEKEASTGVGATTFGADLLAWLAFARTRMNRPTAPAIVVKIPTPGPSYASTATVRSQVDGIASASVPKVVVVENGSGTSVHYPASEHITLGHTIGTALIALMPDWSDA